MKCGSCCGSIWRLSTRCWLQSKVQPPDSPDHLHLGKHRVPFLPSVLIFNTSRIREPSLLLTQHVQSGLGFLLSDHSQPTPVSRERRHLSIQEGILGADRLSNRKTTTEVDAKHGFSRLEELLRTVFTFQQSRFQVGFGDVVSVVSVNLNKRRLTSATDKYTF